MKRQFPYRSAFFNSRVLITFLLCGAACCIVTGIPTTSGLAFFRTEAPAKVSQSTLTFAERVAYQRAIEEVYWRHRIWPKERPDPKPSLDSVMSEAQLEKKVENYLRDSQALEDYWQRPITAEQLQTEMDRMAQHTKQPEVLRELFAALGNDPFIIAECLARPALAERLLTNWYSYDQRIHGELKQRAEADLQALPAVEQMRQLSGTYSESQLIRRENAVEEVNPTPARRMKLNKREWDETAQKLTEAFDKARGVEAAYETIPTGRLSRLQEDEAHYYVTAVIEKGEGRLKFATVSWFKESLQSWLAREENRVAAVVPLANYKVPEIADGTSCVDNTWTATAGAPPGRAYHTAVWTGSEMIVWAGDGAGNTGGRYDPATDRWTATTTINAPSARSNHTAVWTGSEMIVWGGDYGGTPFNTGGRYNPSADSWIATSTANAPSARYHHTAVWTGGEMIIWGGYDGNNDVNTGGRYNPATDTWIATSTTDAPSARLGHTAVWSGNEMIVWGGGDCCNGFNTGGRYNPGTDSWTATATSNAPSARGGHTAVWTGSEMIIWGGYSGGPVNTGGRYNPVSNSWTSTSTTNAPESRTGHSAVWTGTEMIVWGGEGDLNTGGRYSPSSDSWIATSTSNAPDGRNGHTAVWTGTEMIVWGGYSPDVTDTGGRYNPTTDSWVPTSGAPLARSGHTAVWTGVEMIVWGGGNDLNTGSRYNPTTDSWAATSVTNAPAGRYHHVAVWTGNEMIIWGGVGGGTFLNTGGRYNPSTDSWIATSTTGAPAAREFHTAVWTGTEMIVWGGLGEFNSHFNTGGR
jgi:N-acetylneuraminic acid mutarotase